MQVSWTKVALLCCMAGASATSAADIRIKLTGGIDGQATNMSTDIPNQYRFGADDGEYKANGVNLTFIGDGGGYLDLSGVQGEGTLFDTSGIDLPYTRNDLAVTVGIAGSTGWTFYFGGRSSIAETDYNNDGKADEKLESYGPVLGLAKTFSILERNLLSFSLGAGLLGGEYELEGQSGLEPDITTGFSAGVGYTFLINDHFSVGVEHKMQQYIFEFAEDDPLSPLNGQPVLQIDDTVAATSAYLVISF